MGSEAERQMELHTPLGPKVLLIKHIFGVEQLSTCFEYVLTLYSEVHTIEAKSLLGQHGSIKLQCGGQPERFIDGMICEFGHTGGFGRYSTYRMVLRPWLWFLANRSDCRVFQNQNTVDIMRKVVSDWQDCDFDFEAKLNTTPPKRPYCVQYNESDLAFVMRLLEDEGIYFFFEHEQGHHKLILADHKSKSKPAPGFDKIAMREWESEKTDAASIHTWRSNSLVTPGGIALRDYDFEKPRADLDTSLYGTAKHSRHKVTTMYEYPGHYSEVGKGDKRARVRLEELHAHDDVVEATTDASGLNAGVLFTLEKHPRKPENQEYLVTACAIEADSGAFESGDGGSQHFGAKVRCVPSKTPFRPQRVTPWPIVPGAQTATVVGKEEGEPSTDDYGRIRVHFPWNLARTADKSADPPDDDTSCWVRVAQGWTGSGFGGLFIPRAGQEVVVEFLDGNPDRPLVTGCVYNNRNKLPYELPGKVSCSGIKTRTLDHGGVEDFNELRFDDAKGEEELFIQAQRDMTTNVKNDCTATVGNDDTRTVENNLKLTVSSGDYISLVEKGLASITVLKDSHTIQAVEIFDVADKKISLELPTSSIVMDAKGIKLTVPGSSITLDMTGVTLEGQGTKVMLNAAGLTVQALMVNLNG